MISKCNNMAIDKNNIKIYKYKSNVQNNITNMAVWYNIV
jgi:hypothetical protein